MAEHNSLRVELDGSVYTLVSNTSVERLQETADLTARKMAAVRATHPHYSGARAAMLVALQLAEELLNLQDEYLALLEEAEIGAPALPPVEAAANQEEKNRKS